MMQFVTQMSGKLLLDAVQYCPEKYAALAPFLSYGHLSPSGGKNVNA